MKRILIILILLTSCGYQPLYSNKDSKGITFREIDLVGDLKINRKLISSLNIEKKAEQYRFEKIVFTSSKQIIETSKNSKGQVDSYKMDLNVVVVIENPDKKVKEKSYEYFSSRFVQIAQANLSFSAIMKKFILMLELFPSY